MTDVFSKEKRSAVMSKIHQPTKLEGVIHLFLLDNRIEHEMYPKVEGNPDVKIGSVYVFVDGCFWHCCPKHYRRPKSNLEFWVPHIEESNGRREEARVRLPYRWVRVWEHEVKDGSYKEMLLNKAAIRNG